MVDARVKEFNNLIAEISSEETKKIIQNYREKIKKKEEEIEVYQKELEIEIIQLDQSIKKMGLPKEGAYDKIRALSFVTNLNKEGNTIVVTTKDCIVTRGKSKLNLGGYIIRIGKSSDIKIKRINGKIGYVEHLFVNDNGELCFGNQDIEDKVYEWKRIGLPHLGIAMIWDILSNFPPTSTPYISWADCKAELRGE